MKIPSTGERRRQRLIGRETENHLLFRGGVGAALGKKGELGDESGNLDRGRRTSKPSPHHVESRKKGP